jgi:hypothetical protein
MRKLIAILCLASTCSLVFAAHGPAVTKAYVDDKGRVHIVTADGREHAIRPEKWQSGGGFEGIQIAPDGQTVGWLADQMLTPLEGATSYPYAVSLELDVWRAGRVIRRFSPPALTIQNWIFLKDGNEVAFHVAPTHGQEFYDCTLLDVNTGKEIAHWSLDRKDYVVPDWAKPLLVDDPLPGPDEIHYWIPDSPTPTKTAPQPKQ